MWWIYFVVPSGPLLEAHRERSWGWGYGHIPLFGATVAVGAGLHVAAYYIEHDTHLSAVGTLATVAVPLAVYFVMLFLLYMQISRTFDPLHVVLFAITVAILVGSMLLASGRRRPVLVPARAGRLAVGDRGRLRDRRAPAQPGRCSTRWYD